MFSEKNWKKVDLLKSNPLMQEKAKKEEEEKVAEAQHRLHWWPEKQKSEQPWCLKVNLQEGADICS